LPQLRHLVGLAALIDWMERWRDVRHAVNNIGGQTLVLGLEPSQRFALGLPRRKGYGKAAALLLQNDEAEWMGLMQWSMAHVRPEGLVLVAKRQLGVGELPSLPAFALVIQLEGDARQAPLVELGRLDLRRLWQEDGQWRIEEGRPLQAIRVAPSGAPLFAPQDLEQGPTFQELVRQRTRQRAVSQDPGYRGHAPNLSHLSEDFILRASPMPKDSSA
jgi:hypothetical protein